MNCSPSKSSGGVQIGGSSFQDRPSLMQVKLVAIHVLGCNCSGLSRLNFQTFRSFDLLSRNSKAVIVCKHTLFFNLLRPSLIVLRQRIVGTPFHSADSHYTLLATAAILSVSSRYLLRLSAFHQTPPPSRSALLHTSCCYISTLPTSESPPFPFKKTKRD